MMKTAISIAIPIVFLGIFAASVWYVSHRFSALFELTTRWPLHVGVSVLFVGSMMAMLSGARAAGAGIGVLSTMGGYLFSFYVFALLLLLVLQLMQIFWDPPKQLAAWSVLGVAFIITVVGALWANPVRVRKTDIPIEGLSRDISVMHISDVHIGHQRGGDYLEKLVDLTNKHNPDVVLINGDLIDSNAALLPGVLSPLAEFDAPVFFTGGNHDNYVDKRRALKTIKGYGVKILHNEVVEIKGISLVGLDYMNPDENTFDMHPSSGRHTIKSVLPDLIIDNDKPSILMHHSPVGAEYVSQKGIDLMLSGHTHAGQMFPGTIFAPLIFQFNKGLYEVGDLKILVSMGAGTFGPRIRLGTSNEINLIRLIAKS